MPNMSFQKNVGGYLACGRGFANTAITAGGAGDATEIDGDTIDLQGSHVKSASLLIPFTATLAATETITFATNIQESDDGATWDTAEVIEAATIVATGGAGGTTETGCYKVDIDLSGRKRYLRTQMTPDMSAGATDTAAIAGVWVFAGSDEIPVSDEDLSNSST